MTLEPGSASASDYVAERLVASFGPDDMTKTLEIALVEDEGTEPTETFTAQLEPLPGAGGGTVTVVPGRLPIQILGAVTYPEDFEDRACDYLREEEVRSIFGIPAGTALEVSRFSPCTYKWKTPRPGPATPIEHSTGISYVVTVAEDEEAARESFAGATAIRTHETFTKPLRHKAVQGIGDEAAWEATHGSLVVRSGNLVFRTQADSTYY
jgi:hypothetical protein